METSYVSQIVDVIIPIVFFATMFGVFYLFISTRNKERMAMIEKGIDPRQFQNKKSATSTFLKLGIVAIGVAIGIFGGQILEAMLDSDKYYASMVILFGGIGLVATFFVDKKVGKKDE